MSERAHVSSVEALAAFRTSLIIYLSKARPTLEEVSAEVLRTRVWLEDEQRVYWESQIRRRARELEQAQQALFGARLSNLRDESAAEVLAVQRAKHALEEAREKLKVLKHWARDFESRVQPLVKQVEKLHTVLANEMPQAIAYLAEVVKTLDTYADILPPSYESAPNPASASSPEPAAADPGASSGTADTERRSQ